MRLRSRSRKCETFSITMQEIRGTKERVKKEGGGEKHENGEPTRRSKINKGYTRIRGKNRKI